MTVPSTSYRLADIESMLQTETGTVEIECDDYVRTRVHSSNCDVLTERFDDSRATCLQFRVAQGSRIAIDIDAVSGMQTAEYGGWTCSTKDGQIFWLPVMPVVRRVNDFGQILEERNPAAPPFRYDDGKLSLAVEAPDGWVADIVAWRFEDRDCLSLIAGRSKSAVEKQAYFLWGSHTGFAALADLYLHVIHGYVYENRYAWPHKRRICSENDAHVLYVTLTGLFRATGDPAYDFARRQVVYSVVARQGPDGEWRHGEWTEFRESHFRLHASAMHLLMDAIEERGSDLLLDRLNRAANFAAGQTDKTDLGIWFLHDELETSEELMQQCPLGWTRSESLGKSVSNQLVLNTHLDTLVGLTRHARITQNSEFSDLITEGFESARRVLSLKPVQPLYRVLFWMLSLNLMSTTRARKLPLPVRAIKRLAREHLEKRWPQFKARYPRIVMPGGYIDRALTVGRLSDNYLGINMMDLLRAHRQQANDLFLSTAAGGQRFAEDIGIVDRWSETASRRYAIGFYGEALYHLFMLERSESTKRAIVELSMQLKAAGVGVPPSWLGANAEVVPPSAQVPTPDVGSPDVLVINLSGAAERLFVLVNTSDHDVRLDDANIAGTQSSPEQSGSGRTLRAGEWMEISA